MKIEAGPGSGGRWVDRWLQRLFDWATGLPPGEAAAIRDELMTTVMLRPAGLLLSGISVLVMSGSAMAMTGSGWATAWFVVDLVALLARCWPTWRAARRGGTMPLDTARRVVASAFVLFVLFGAGCTASIVAGGEGLRLTAVAALVALAAGLATRWAALPRMAIGAIVLCVIPFSVAMIASGHDGVLQVIAAAAGTAALTLQNHRTLIAMIRAERRARLLAETDALTGLPNRNGLSAGWRRLAARSGGGTVAALFIDLDGFKAINDHHGHAAGDAVLVAVARRLDEIAAGRLACRLGGDEFVVVDTDADPAAVATLCRRIAERMCQPILLAGGDTVRVSASIGTASDGCAGLDEVDRLLARADAALYRSKRARGAPADTRGRSVAMV